MPTQPIKTLLAQLGLSDTESRTYIALLGLESVSIRKVSEASGINRGTTHECLKSLVNWGLVGVRRSGAREYYSAESPEKIYAIIQDQRKELLSLSETAKRVVPELLASHSITGDRPLVRYYQDDEGIVAILQDVLHTCRVLESPQYCAYSSRPLRQYLYRKFPKFTQRRIAEGIHVRVIAIGEGGDQAVSAERRWIPEPQDGSISSYTIIYGNKIAMISISSDLTPYGVVIEDAGAASMQTLLFSYLWHTLNEKMNSNPPVQNANTK